MSAPPGKRDDDIHYYEKSSYKMKDVDRRKMGARHRSMLAKASGEKGKNTKRNVWQGTTDLFPGSEELFSIGNGITEDIDNSYKVEEKKIFEVKNSQHEIKMLIEQLEKKENGKDAQE